MSDAETTHPFRLDHPPIIEAIVDIDCELSPSPTLADLEQAALESLQDRYPKLEKRMFHQYGAKIPKPGEAPSNFSMQNEALDGLLFRSEDGKQLTQFRSGGYSFNRLAPYEGMDRYLPEIERTWENYCRIAQPLRIGKIGLRTMDQIEIPLNPAAPTDLSRYFTLMPHLPKVGRRALAFTGFLHQHQIVDAETGQQVSMTLAHCGFKEEKVVIFMDVDVYDPTPRESMRWEDVAPAIRSLRSLKNEFFLAMVTEECLKLFSNP